MSAGRGVEVTADGVRLRAVRSWRAVLGWLALYLAVGWLILTLIGWLLDEPFDVRQLVTLMIIFFPCLIGWELWRAARDRLRFDGEGVHVVSGRSRTTYAWNDLLEVGWWRAPGLAGVVVRPRGGRWDNPGPNAPALLGQIHSQGRDAHAQAPELLRQWCERHDVTFVADGRALFEDRQP